ncbi:PLP-dependent aminotransferase family protein [Fibrobacter sp. UWB11]|uniref:MocR-like pyridoxine biosynthesis transcription factor PdxR n=1 Tax=Fibrobacter sp. UWB11 TaxID=1896202 RepID=UPI000929FC50|nr:PLP-dependent aminotransferase family protein [Fibrobacter sp. UWB11]SIO39694.1 transcriptional regulator, GntR family [Fibrobacter sp. UWB11]
MFTYDMSKAGSNSLYHYLYQCIKKDIVSGKILADEQIPSKRSLAQNLGVSVVTIENAYAQLLAEGFIYSLPKKGFFVVDINAKATSQVQTRQKSYRSRRLRADFHEESEHTNPKYIADFASNGADIEAFPFSTWAKITREVLCERQKDLLQVSPGVGTLELRRAIVRMLREFRNIQVTPEQIVIGAGTDYLYGLLVQLLGFDKCYAVEDPGWSKISKIYSQYGVKVNHVPVEGDNFVDALKKSNADIVHISPAHHFPTGKVMPVGERYRLLSWAAESPKRYIVEDDYDSEFRMTGKPIPALQNIDVTEKVVYLNTFSKTMTSAIRLSYMVLPPHLAEKFHNELSFYSCTVSTLDQYVMAKFIDLGYYETHINRMRNLYRSKRDALLTAIDKSKLSKVAHVYEEDAGLHFILEMNTNCSDAEFGKRLRQKGVNVKALSEYYFEATPSEHKFVINYSSVERNKMKKAVQIIADLFQV